MVGKVQGGRRLALIRCKCSLQLQWWKEAQTIGGTVGTYLLQIRIPP